MNVNKMYQIIESIYYMMKLNVLWIIYVLRGGVIFGVIPSTLALCSCLRNEIRHNNSDKLSVEYKIEYNKVFKESLSLLVPFAGIVLLLLFEEALLNGIGTTSLVLEILIKVFRAIIVMTVVFFFPTYVHFELHGIKIFLQPFLLLFICPVQVLLCIVVIAIAATLYFINPLLVIFLGVGFPMYAIMHMMIKKFDKMQANIPYMKEV
ncbi:YesL family protein [Lapidilactobacillus achengensis]|uniref:YesL family protein n=1 Tax=Lapidilactobacillus achengensis TaxID=2486000 RepID=A0ABW1UQW8_9LACO|nr:DUF624 domain-containing protein [Lapidilactobacillus achengensis]